MKQYNESDERLSKSALNIEVYFSSIIVVSTQYAFVVIPFIRYNKRNSNWSTTVTIRGKAGEVSTELLSTNTEVGVDGRPIYFKSL